MHERILALLDPEHRQRAIRQGVPALKETNELEKEEHSMTTPAFAETARIRSSDGQWTAEIGYYPAEDGDGNPSGFTVCDRLYGDSKQAVIDSARRHYPGISIDTVFGHLTGEDGTAGPRPGAKGSSS